jgi:hypothetical protein
MGFTDAQARQALAKYSDKSEALNWMLTNGSNMSNVNQSSGGAAVSTEYVLILF